MLNIIGLSISIFLGVTLATIVTLGLTYLFVTSEYFRKSMMDMSFKCMNDAIELLNKQEKSE